MEVALVVEQRKHYKRYEQSLFDFVPFYLSYAEIEAL
jgi:hypothetical protein